MDMEDRLHAHFMVLRTPLLALQAFICFLGEANFALKHNPGICMHYPIISICIDDLKCQAHQGADAPWFT